MTSDLTITYPLPYSTVLAAANLKHDSHLAFIPEQNIELTAEQLGEHWFYQDPSQCSAYTAGG